jgi:ribonuclease HI
LRAGSKIAVMSRAAHGTKSFTCATCGQTFSVPQVALDKYPRWTPARCMVCRRAAESGAAAKPPPSAATGKPPLSADPPPSAGEPSAAPLPREPSTLEAEIRQRHSAGPRDGVFTDGACSGNPGPGGWAAVFIKQDQIVDQRYGGEPHTTNNRMELTALVAGLQLIGLDEEVTIWSDSQLCVNTINDWAPAWERRGWRRKGGPIANLELVQELYALARARPRAKLRWIKAHDGSRWNEYVDALSTAQIREASAR